jgi:hypothetical protein
MPIETPAMNAQVLEVLVEFITSMATAKRNFLHYYYMKIQA